MPYFSTEEEAKTEAERFVEAQKLVNAPLLFIESSQISKGTLEQLKLIQELVLQKTGKQVFTYAGSHCLKLGLDRVDWYPNYVGLKTIRTRPAYSSVHRERKD